MIVVILAVYLCVTIVTFFIVAAGVGWDPDEAFVVGLVWPIAIYFCIKNAFKKLKKRFKKEPELAKARVVKDYE